MKIDAERLALVAFRTKTLGEDYFSNRGIKTCTLVPESDLDPATQDLIAGENVFIYESAEMLQEMQRKGASFPFGDFVSTYSPDHAA